MNRMMSAKEKLQQYIAQTTEIRELSSLSIYDIAGANKYHDMLLKNYLRIRELVKESGEILERYFYPIIRSEQHLEREEIDEMRRFADALIDAYNLNNMDCPIVYRQAEKLMRETEDLEDDELRILALDSMVTATYLMLSMTARLLPTNDICFEYYRAGLKAGELLLEYLKKEKFVTLSEEMKELVVVNARYIRVVSEVDDVPGDPEHNALTLERMLNALALADDPFYRDQLPSYDWDLHCFRTYEYICSLTDLNNVKNYNSEQLKLINECTKRMKALYDSDQYDFKKKHLTRDIEIYVIRNAYLAGEIDLPTCKEGLGALLMRDFREDRRGQIPMVMLQAPLEYMLLLDPENLSADEESHLSYFYNRLIMYMHQTPKRDMLTFLLTCLSLILKYFIEIPGGMDIETMGLSLIAALHPPTYVHSLSVSDFAKCLTWHLLRRRPELFVGMFGYEDEEAVLEHTAEIEEYVGHAALCHDFGKLLIAETILTYGRDLLDDEFRYIHVHPAVGAFLLSKHAGTADYADVALGHHKWFNDQGGYPASFRLSESPFRTAIAIVTCADCLDAATDAVGRSYKEGKSFEQFLEELRRGSGTIYAPYLAELLDDPEVRTEIEILLKKGRDENYRKTYFTLKKYM